MRKISEFRPNILHYCGHGIGDGVVLFDEAKRDESLGVVIPLERLNEALKSNNVEGLIMSCCDSGNTLMKLPSPQWIMAYSSLGNERNITISKKFYQQISQPHSQVEKALENVVSADSPRESRPFTRSPKPLRRVYSGDV
jgi:hypothetical protein